MHDGPGHVTGSVALIEAPEPGQDLQIGVNNQYDTYTIKWFEWTSLGLL